MSFVLDDDTGEKYLFSDVLSELGAEIIGDALFCKIRNMADFCKAL